MTLTKSEKTKDDVIDALGKLTTGQKLRRSAFWAERKITSYLASATNFQTLKAIFWALSWAVLQLPPVAKLSSVICLTSRWMARARPQLQSKDVAAYKAVLLRQKSVNSAYVRSALSERAVERCDALRQRDFLGKVICAATRNRLAQLLRHRVMFERLQRTQPFRSVSQWFVIRNNRLYHWHCKFNVCMLEQTTRYRIKLQSSSEIHLIRMECDFALRYFILALRTVLKDRFHERLIQG